MNEDIFELVFYFSEPNATAVFDITGRSRHKPLPVPKKG
jgi:hypothetical protein